MTTILYVLIGASALVEATAGIWLATAGARHPIASWVAALAGGRTEAPEAYRYLVYFVALACFMAAALHVLIWRWLRDDREEAHSLLMLYGVFSFVGGLLLFGATFVPAGAAGGPFHFPAPAWLFLIGDSLRGALLVTFSGIVRRSPQTVRELRLPSVRARSSSERVVRRADHRTVGATRHEGAGRVGARAERKAVAVHHGRSVARAEATTLPPRRTERRRAEPREAAASPERREAATPYETGARRGAIAPESAGGMRRHSRRGGRGPRGSRAGGLAAEGALAGANAARGAEPERDSVSLESSRARSEYSEARERDLRPRPARRPIRGGFRPPVEDIESQSIESVSNERRSGVKEVQPSIEWAANVGSRKKRGRYSTGALFRPREKRLRRPLGGGEAIPDRDWSWPANEEQALSDKEATRVGEEETRVESQAGKEDRSEANGGA